MTSILDFLKQYGVQAFVIIIIAVAVILLVYQKRKDVLYHAALYAVSKAQEAWGNDMGKIKFAEAYSYLKKEFPIITFLVSEQQLTEIINRALEDLKKLILAKAEKARKAGIALEDMDYITQSIIDQTGNTEKFSEPIAVNGIVTE